MFEFQQRASEQQILHVVRLPLESLKKGGDFPMEIEKIKKFPAKKKKKLAFISCAYVVCILDVVSRVRAGRW